MASRARAVRSAALVLTRGVPRALTMTTLSSAGLAKLLLPRCAQSNGGRGVRSRTPRRASSSSDRSASGASAGADRGCAVGFARWSRGGRSRLVIPPRRDHEVGPTLARVGGLVCQRPVPRARVTSPASRESSVARSLGCGAESLAGALPGERRPQLGRLTRSEIEGRAAQARATVSMGPASVLGPTLAVRAVQLDLCRA